MKTTSGFLKKCSPVFFGSVLFFLLPAITIQAQEGVKSSLKFIETGQSLKAVEVLTKAITEQPEAITLYYYLGYAQLKAGENDRALETFEKGIARNDKEPLLYAGKGHVLLIKNNEAEGKALVDKAMGLAKGKNVAALQAVGRAYLANPKFVKKHGIAGLKKQRAFSWIIPKPIFCWVMLT
ncbi:MAG: tetratricopeptide repeat protein [Bacteroidota bacterium]